MGEGRAHEDSTDKFEQRLARLDRLVNKTALNGTELVAEEKLANAHDRGDGCADLVGDGGEELGPVEGGGISRAFQSEGVNSAKRT